MNELIDPQIKGDLLGELAHSIMIIHLQAGEPGKPM
jgi:hypothetical protein